MTLRTAPLFAAWAAPVDSPPDFPPPAVRGPRSGHPLILASRDRRRQRHAAVAQILLNLLSIAVKCTDRGGRLRMWAEGDAEVVRIHVSDTGRGIAADKTLALPREPSPRA